MFELDERLAGDSFHVTDLPLSELRLMNNQTLPWLMLIPKQAGLTELTDLSLEDQQTLLEEINVLHRVIQAFSPDKINTAAIGNVVSQLHVHVIGRYTDDPEWPAPVWGRIAANAYPQAQADRRITQLRELLNEEGF